MKLSWGLLALLIFCRQAQAQAWRLDPSTGSLHVFLYKDGPLRLFGHDHVVEAAAFQGEVEVSSAAARLALTIETAGLRIDEPRTRKALGMREIVEGDRQKIDAQMRGPKGLDVEKHPLITLQSQSIEPVAGEKDLWLVTALFSLHGTTSTIDFPVTMSSSEAGRWFSGYVRLRPSEYGIKPASAVLGGVRTKDEALVRFSLFAK